MLNIYRASAGSGKTYRLTQDYIRLLFSEYKNDRAHRRVLAVTFTNKATDEMKSRVLQELYTLSVGGKSGYRADLMQRFAIDENTVNERAKKILVRILHDYSAFSISTIDAFFQQVLRSFAREIGISGGYNLELDTEETLENAVDALFKDLSKTENKQLLQWLTKFAEENVEQSENWNIRDGILKLGKEIFKENYQHKAEETNEKLHDKTFLSNYISKIRSVQSDFEKDVSEEAAKALEIIRNNGLKNTDFKGNKIENSLNKVIKKDFDLSKNKSLETYAESVENCYGKTTQKPVTASIEAAYANGLGEALKTIVRMLTEDIVRYNTADLMLKHLNTLGVLSDLAMYIKQFSSEQNSMLISDTNMLLNKIIEDSDTPFVYERTGINVEHFMIDEFQDTSVLQWKNFKPLIDNSLACGKENMLVGDVKQSIYRWRNSDWKLLQEQVSRDFSSEQIKNEILETNWRSDRNIVEFNNDFFQKASRLAQAKFNESIEPLLSVYPALEEFTRKISNAYSDVNQKVKTEAGAGHVKIEFVPNEGKKEAWTRQSLERVPNIIENLIDRGYKACDVAFLVRTKEQAAMLINYLFQYKNSPEARTDISYNIIGNEGLTLSSSLSVVFIVSLLKTLENPQDDIQRTIMNYEYLRGKLKKTDEEAVRMALTEQPTDFRGVSVHFTKEENQTLNEIRSVSLYEQIETIIRAFNLTDWHNEAVFLQAFQDVVFKFVSVRNADLNSFLLWWDKNGEKQYISTPENEDAFRVMTIHKSKGLDFKAVIVPFCDWPLDANKIGGLMWLQTEEPPFNELPLIPISFSSKLSHTVFARQYYEELLHQYVDSLNIAYVAFTRARNELICLSPLPKEISSENKKTALENIASLSGLFLKYIELKDITEEKTGETAEESLVYEIGEPTMAVYDKKTPEITVEKVNGYPVVSSDNRLKIKSLSREEWKTDKTIADNPLNYGVIMHEILQKLTKREEEEKIVQEMIHSGKINEEESEIIRQSLAKFWQLPDMDKWFFAEGKTLNEATVLLPTGEHYRPDKVIINGQKAVVADYKFGKEKRPNHEKQIRQYAEILRQMNYEPETYLVYVTLAETIKV